MNRIFYAMIAIAFVFAGWRQLQTSDSNTPEVVIEAVEPPPAAQTPPESTESEANEPGPDSLTKSEADNLAAEQAEHAAAATDVESRLLYAKVDALQARMEELEAGQQAEEAAPPPPPTNYMKDLQDAILSRSELAVSLILRIVGAMAFFLGLMKVAEEGGLLTVIARLLRPLMTRLFPGVPPDHPAMAAMILNLSANALGLGNAATPLGIKAMHELDKLNPYKGTASNAMVLFLAINTSSVTLLPTGVIVWRQSLGSASAASIVPTTLFATFFSTSIAIMIAFLYARFTAKPEDITPEEDIKPLPEQAHEEMAEGYPLWVSALVMIGLLAAIPFTVLKGEQLAPWIIPGLTFTLLTYGFVKGVPVYESFIRGAKEGVDIAVRIVPYLVAILAAVGMFKASGALDLLIGVLNPITAPLGLPGEALPMALLRPLSGSGAQGIMIDIMSNPETGPDTYTGMLVSTLNGSTETTFYVLAVYFGAVGIKRIRHAMATALTADFAGVVGSVIAVSAYFWWSAS